MANKFRTENEGRRAKWSSFPCLLSPFSVLFFFLLLTNSLAAQTPSAKECKDFHTGTYYVKGMPNVIITRDSLYQVERDQNDGTYVKMSITWTSPCTYELRLIKTTKHHDKKMWRKMKVLKVTITYVDDNSYRFSATSELSDQPIVGTIVKKSD